MNTFNWKWIIDKFVYGGQTALGSINFLWGVILKTVSSPKIHFEVDKCVLADKQFLVIINYDKNYLFAKNTLVVFSIINQHTVG